MDRYQKVEKPRPEVPINENEIRITASGLVRNYLTYATTLLQVLLPFRSSNLLLYFLLALVDRTVFSGSRVLFFGILVDWFWCWLCFMLIDMDLMCLSKLVFIVLIWCCSNLYGLAWFIVHDTGFVLLFFPLIYWEFFQHWVKLCRQLSWISGAISLGL